MAAETSSIASEVRAAARAIGRLGDADRAAQMQAYMKGHFEFFGVQATPRRQAQKSAIRATRAATADEVLDAVRWCWTQPQREVQYLGADVLRAAARNLTVAELDDVRALIESRSWWDTIDSLAAHAVGVIVRHDRAGSPVMDRWVDDDNMWVARTAILHQLTWRADAEPDRLFDYAVRRGADEEFFIRKALGWALRSLARVEPDRVRSFVTEHSASLSGLTIREATKHL